MVFRIFYGFLGGKNCFQELFWEIWDLLAACFGVIVVVFLNIFFVFGDQK